ncbi:putative thioredoxin reductase protein [Neofusicoccum parvum UCRNP2]|uniref:Putative thioredoxin reductase protein n=1 Tax=Botryosphaeria parva (strain UCR-NP2) TaxID=1287680 RepID=R1E7A0_BOTPV|nr:putative thioredoxin reductase protein [Neofusicoccum parvum UCRNP2]
MFPLRNHAVQTVAAMATKAEVLIIGGGPAGLSAALSLARARRSAIVFDSKEYRNAPTEHLHTYITWDHHHPAELRAAARKELLEGRYNTIKLSETAVKVVTKLPDGSFKATDAAGREWIGDKLVLATGVRDVLPDIPGFAQCWGRSIYHCMFCHGFEDTGAQSAGVLALADLAKKEQCYALASMAQQFAASLTFYTDADQQLADDIQSMLKPSSDMTVETKKIDRLEPATGGGVNVFFADGSSAHEAFLVYQPKMEANVGMVADLCLELSPSGAEVKVTPPFNETSVPGCFAVGDVSTPMKALAIAAGSGSIAGPAVVQQLIREGKPIAFDPKT